MDIKEALAEARRGLTTGLRGWIAPRSKLLAVDPAQANACLKIALRYRHETLALAAAKTLGLFAPDLLWRGLLGCAAVDVASLVLDPTLAVMAAMRDKRWVRSKGGTTRVASYLIDMLMHGPRSMDPIYLWRLSFDQPEDVPAPYQHMVRQARTIRRGMVGWLGMEDEDTRKARRVMRDLSALPDGKLMVEISTTAFRLSLACPVLMVPLLRMIASEGLDNPSGDWAIPSPQAHSVSPLVPQQVLTHDTPAGRKSIREIISATPGLIGEIKRLGLSEEDAIVSVGELIERQDEEKIRPPELVYTNLCEVSRWSGAGSLSRTDAQRINQLLLANASVNARIRASNIPPPLLDFFNPEHSRGFQ